MRVGQGRKFECHRLAPSGIRWPAGPSCPATLASSVQTPPAFPKARQARPRRVAAGVLPSHPPAGPGTPHLPRMGDRRTDLSPLGTLVRRADPDRFLTALFAPAAPARGAVHALRVQPRGRPGARGHDRADDGPDPAAMVARGGGGCPQAARGSHAAHPTAGGWRTGPGRSCSPSWMRGRRRRSRLWGSGGSGCSPGPVPWPPPPVVCWACRRRRACGRSAPGMEPRACCATRRPWPAPVPAFSRPISWPNTARRPRPSSPPRAAQRCSRCSPRSRRRAGRCLAGRPHAARRWPRLFRPCWAGGTCVTRVSPASAPWVTGSPSPAAAIIGRA